MADFPALPLWTDAYLADTRHLSTIEHGAYLLLIIEAWRRPSCTLPDDDIYLARLAGCNDKQWSVIKPVIMAFWKRDGRTKTWSQKRLSAERKYVAGRSKVQKDKALKRWNNQKKDDAAALPKRCPGDAPTPTPNSLDKSKAADPEKIMFDSGLIYLADNGISEGKARPMLGKWKRDHGAANVIAALGKAQREGALEPISFIEACLKTHAKHEAWESPC